MANCPHCGAITQTGDTFCLDCGGALTAAGMPSDDPENAARGGYVLLEEDRPGEAEAVFRAAIERDPDDPDHHIGHGYALLALDRLDQAEEAFLTAGRLLDDDEAEPVLAGRAWVAYRTDRFGLAKSHFIELCTVDPEDADYQLGYGLCALQEGMALDAAADALEAFDAALALDSDLVHAHLGRAMALGTLYDPAGSVAAANDTLARDADCHIARVVQADALLELDDGEAAQAALAALPADGFASAEEEAERLAVSARILLHQGQAEQAGRQAKRAVALAPRAESALLVLGDVRVAAGDLVGAYEALDRAVTVDTANPHSLVPRGAVLEAMGKAALAHEDYRAALQNLEDADCNEALQADLRARLARIENEL